MSHRRRRRTACVESTQVVVRDMALRRIAMPPDGISSAGTCSIDQPPAAARSKNAGRVAAPGIGDQHGALSGRGRGEHGEQRHGVSFLVQDVRGQNDVEAGEGRRRRVPVQSAVTMRRPFRSAFRRRATGLWQPSPSPARPHPRAPRRTTATPARNRAPAPAGRRGRASPRSRRAPARSATARPSTA